MKLPQPEISIIIIDYKENNPYLKECLDAIGKQSYKKYEIILLTDSPSTLNYPKLRKKSYAGKWIAPAHKRDDGAKLARGKILVFIDDDAYPHRDWLGVIASSFKQYPSLGAVGGPGITPFKVGWKEEASGWASASPMGAGFYTYRFLSTKSRFVDDYPSMNLAIKKKDFLTVGGFDSHYWPGEDTKLCLDLTYKLKKKILYNPGAIVYHHRRPLWLPHLRQNGNFGLHRGFFARTLPQNSFKLIYLGPPFMVLGSFYLILAFIFPLLRLLPFLTSAYVLFFLYLFALLLNGVWVFWKSNKINQAFLSPIVILFTHVWYGIRFLQGFFFVIKLKR